MGDALFRKKFDTPEEINGRYTLIKRVGKGSYGVVYEALDTETNDKVSALRGTQGKRRGRRERAWAGRGRRPQPAARGWAPRPNHKRFVVFRATLGGCFRSACRGGHACGLGNGGGPAGGRRGARGRVDGSQARRVGAGLMGRPKTL